MAWVVSMEVIFSCLNLKHDGFLPYSMPKVFNKTGNGLSGIIIACACAKPILHPELFWAERYMHLLSTRVELKALHHGWGLCKKSL